MKARAADQATEEHVTDLLIGGNLVGGAGAEVDVINPATEARIGSVRQATPEQLNAAVAAARQAFDEGGWSDGTGTERAAALVEAARLFESHGDDFVDELVAETGCTVGSTRGQIGAVPDILRWHAERAALDRTRRYGSDAPPVGGVVRYVPVGVVAAITAYNSPLMLAIQKIAPALAAGCTVVLMPSPRAPLATLRLGALLSRCLPPGALNVLVGDAGISRLLTEHPGVDKVSFTGSVEVGGRIAVQAGSSIKDMVLELGGKAPCVLLPDCDLDQIVKPVLSRLFRNAGQSCQAPSRLIVHKDLMERFVELSRRVVDEFVIGDPTDPATDVGPVIGAAHRDRIDAFVDSAVEEGGTIIARSSATNPDRGFWVAPTLVGGLPNSARIAREEIFGPVGVVLTYDDVADAVRIANDSEYGLCAYVFGTDTSACEEVADSLRVGTVYVNGLGMGMGIDVPSGGFKKSGYGRERGEEGIREFLATKHLQWATS